MKSIINNENFPDKFFYKIGEVSKIVGVEPHVLRYWEKEFGFDNTKRIKSKQRHYEKKDILKFIKIRKLLHDDKYTIEGAKKILSKPQKSFNTSFIISELEQIKNFLIDSNGA